MAIDIELLMDNFGGDAGILQSAIELFVDTYADEMQRIRSALEAGDARAMGENAHSLKGVVGMFTRADAYELCYSIEQLGRNGEISDRTRNLVGCLETEISALVESLRRAMTRLPTY